MKITYTASAEEQLRAFAEQQRRYLEKLIVDRKAVPGDDVVEVTASDIKEAGALIRPFKRNGLFTSFGRSLSAVYFICGITMAAVGLYYDKLKLLLQESPQQASIFVAGLALALVGSVSYVYFRSKDRRYRELNERRQAAPRIDVEERAESRLLLPPDQFVYSVLSDFLSNFPAFQRQRFVLEVRNGVVDLTAFDQSLDGTPQHFKYKFNRGPEAKISDEVGRLRSQIARDVVRAKLDTPPSIAPSN